MRPKYPVLLVAGLGGLFTVVNLTSAQTWTPTGAPCQRWASVASSADGIKLVAAGRGSDIDARALPHPIYTSADSGMTWTQTSAPTNTTIWSSVASSANGTKLAAVGQSFDFNTAERTGGQIYTSADSGMTWTQTSAPTNTIWSSVASSADGTKLAAVGPSFDFNTAERIGGQIYTSTNSGATWMQTSAPSNYWSSVASSGDGTKLVAVISYDRSGSGGPIYTSRDSGATWTQSSAPSNYWSSVASSADGTKLVAAGDGTFYTSTNSGVTWTQTSAPGNNWTSVASSADGTKLVAAEYGGSIYTSTDSGMTWTQTKTSGESPLACVASSADGSKLVAGAFRIYTTSYLGPWRLASAPAQEWSSVASSTEGTKLVAVASNDEHGLATPIYTSTNSGATWTQTSAPTNRWSSVASSADGSKLMAVASGYVQPIYTSPDSGATWMQTSAPNNYWSSVASSADGGKVVAATKYDPSGHLGLIYTSTNSGATWTQTSAPSNYWSSVASSADGTKLVAAGGFIYTSADSGATWMQTSASGYNWLSVASSADGSKLVATTSGGPIYTSTDSGATWTQTIVPPHRWASVASSADGTKLVAVAGSELPCDGVGPDGLIYASMDSGKTWTQTSAPNHYWTAVASSADGSKVVAVASFYGAIYTLQFPISPPPPQPLPQLSISASGGSLGVSWLVPSTSFVLEQSFDLNSTNWTDVPTPPTLNFTNLHNQVAVSPSVGRQFYRLKQQ